MNFQDFQAPADQASLAMEKTMYRTMKAKTGIGGMEIKMIVTRLTQKPFDFNYSVVTFDEMQPYAQPLYSS